MRYSFESQAFRSVSARNLSPGNETKNRHDQGVDEGGQDAFGAYRDRTINRNPILYEVTKLLCNDPKKSTRQLLV